MSQFLQPMPVSTIFHAEAWLATAYNLPPDLILSSSDGVLFYVHSSVLSLASANGFGGIIGPAAVSVESPVRVDDDSEVLHVVLSAAYGLAIQPQSHRWPTLAQAVAAMLTRYAQPAPAPGDALFGALLAHAHRPGGAPDVFALAAQFAIEPLAVAASEHLLALALPDVAPEWTVRVGAVYMRRLYFLQLGRVAALKRIILRTPALHAPDAACGQRDMQRDVLSPWSLAIAELVIDARADLPGAAVEAKLNPIAYRASCSRCGKAVRDCVDAIVQEWAAVKKTI